jgi:hypothetical protein
MTPSIIPNRDSVPQNHPRPKVAVSNSAGAAASMGGMGTFARSTCAPEVKPPPFVFASGRPAGSRFCEQAVNGVSMTRPSKILKSATPVFFVTIVPSLWQPAAVSTGRRHQKIRPILEMSVNRHQNGQKLLSFQMASVMPLSNSANNSKWLVSQSASHW